MNADLKLRTGRRAALLAIVLAAFTLRVHELTR
jgi:hypothetical protein